MADDAPLAPETKSKPAKILADSVNEQDSLEDEIEKSTEQDRAQMQEHLRKQIAKMNGKPLDKAFAKRLARELGLMALRAYAANAARIKEIAQIRHKAENRIKDEYTAQELADMPVITRDMRQDGKADE